VSLIFCTKLFVSLPQQALTIECFEIAILFTKIWLQFSKCCSDIPYYIPTCRAM